MSRPRLLQLFLVANALFSMLSGIVLIVMPDRIATLLGLPSFGFFAPIGIGLIGWALVVGWQAMVQRKLSLAVLLISFGDFAWVIGSAILLIGWGDALSSTGSVVISSIAILVGLFGAGQLLGIREYHREVDPTLETSWRHQVSVVVDASPSVLWSTIQDLKSIASYSPGLASSTVDRPVQPGAVRTCHDTSGRMWQEECTSITSSDRELTMRFRSERDDWPFPVSKMVGGWNVDAVGDGSCVTVWWSLDPQPSWAGIILVPLLAASQDRAIKGVISRMAGESTKARSIRRKQRARLVAWC